MDIRLALMTGIDIPLPECQLILHQPTIKEISYLGEITFFTGLSLLTIEKEVLKQSELTEEQLKEISNFQIFLKVCEEDKEKKKDIKDVLSMLFQNYKIIMTPRAISLSQDDVSLIIDEQNFDFFQNYLKQVFCLEKGKSEGFNPLGDKAKEIAKKLERARQRVAAEKSNKDKKSLDAYISSLVVCVPSMSLQSVINLTLYQLYDLLERYGLYAGWDLDIKCRLAGGSSKEKSETENWMKSIH